MGLHALRITAVSLTLLAAAPVLAQEATDDADNTVTAVEVEEDGFDWGLLGLLGLLGLAGLRRREASVVHTGSTGRM